jgi:hypothetical protein
VASGDLDLSFDSAADAGPVLGASLYAMLRGDDIPDTTGECKLCNSVLKHPIVLDHLRSIPDPAIGSLIGELQGSIVRFSHSVGIEPVYTKTRP